MATQFEMHLYEKYDVCAKQAVLCIDQVLYCTRALYLSIYILLMLPTYVPRGSLEISIIVLAQLT